MPWTTPKTDWTGTDYFTHNDWLRIVQNLEFIADDLGIPYVPYTAVSKGTVLTSADRNTVSNMVEQIYSYLHSSWNRGYVFPRVDYGSAWNSKDLNNIETLILNLKKQIDGEINGSVEYFTGEEVNCGDDISVGLL